MKPFSERHRPPTYWPVNPFCTCGLSLTEATGLGCPVHVRSAPGSDQDCGGANKGRKRMSDYDMALLRIEHLEAEIERLKRDYAAIELVKLAEVEWLRAANEKLVKTNNEIFTSSEAEIARLQDEIERLKDGSGA